MKPKAREGTDLGPREIAVVLSEESRHFRWDGPHLVGRTPIGRVTANVLSMNNPEVISLRKTLMEEGVFPHA